VAGKEQPVVPIDLLIQQIRVVTIGPNTGKNRYPENTGLGSLDGESGFICPSSRTWELPWFDLVLADIGDEQSEQSLSTFSGHIH